MLDEIENQEDELFNEELANIEDDVVTELIEYPSVSLSSALSIKNSMSKSREYCFDVDEFLREYDPPYNIELGSGWKEGVITVDCNPKIKPDLVWDIHNLPFKDNSIDKCIAHNTLGYVKSPATVLREVNRILKVNGTFEIKEPCNSSDYADLPGIRNKFAGVFWDHVNTFDNMYGAWYVQGRHYEYDNALFSLIGQSLKKLGRPYISRIFRNVASFQTIKLRKILK